MAKLDALQAPRLLADVRAVHHEGPGSGQATLEGPVKAGATLKATASGKDDDEKLSWDFKAAAPVVTRLK